MNHVSDIEKDGGNNKNYKHLLITVYMPGYSLAPLSSQHPYKKLHFTYERIQA